MLNRFCFYNVLRRVSFDFNKDGLIDIYLDGHDANNSNVVKDGAIYMSAGKFTYDILLPTDKDYPLLEIKIYKQPK
jgi:hypothetical protein